jgi:hypothetical protein
MALRTSDKMCRIVPGWPSHNAKLMALQIFFNNVLDELNKAGPDREVIEVQNVFQRERDKLGAKGLPTIIETFEEEYDRLKVLPGIQLPFSDEKGEIIIALLEGDRVAIEETADAIHMDDEVVGKRYRFLLDIQEMREVQQMIERTV